MPLRYPSYTIGQFLDKEKDQPEFEIFEFDDWNDQNEISEFHFHAFYEILWVEKGTSTQMIDYQSYDIGPEMLFFISPGQMHSFETWHKLKGGSILFMPDFINLANSNTNQLLEFAFLDNGYFNPCLKLSSTEFDEIRQTIATMFSENNRTDKSVAILRSLLQILLHRLQRVIDKNRPDGSENIRMLVQIKSFQNLLERHFMDGKTASWYAGQLNMTSHHLNRIVQNISQTSTTQVINNRLILEAKRLLAWSELSVTEIAWKLGFADSSYLARLFSAKTGMAPLTFRNKMSEKYRK